MKNLLATTLLVTSACVHAPMPTNEIVDAPNGENRAIKIVIGEWNERLKACLSDHPLIIWFEGECLVYGNDGPQGNCIQGTYGHHPVASSEIHLLWSEKPSDSALAHEMLHWYLHIVRFDDDVNHKRPEWKQVKYVEETLKEEGL